MTTQELHIEIDLLLQNLNSHWNKNFLPQEKDLFINNEIYKFINQRINPKSNLKGEGFEDTTKRIEDLNILKKTVSIPVQYNQKEIYINFPFDYLKYITCELNTCCCEGKQVVKSYYETEFFPINNIVNFNYLEYLIIKFKQDGNETIIFNTANIPTNYLPQDNIEMYRKQFLLINLIKNVLYKTSKLSNLYEIKFDKFKNVFIIKSDKEFSIEYILNGEVFTPIINKKDYFFNNISSDLYSETRIIDNEYITNVKNSYLSKSKDQSVIALLKNKFLSIIPPKNAIFGMANLTYICRPSMVDLYLNYNSEFDDSILKEIINNVVKTINGILSIEGYEKYIRENTLVE